MLEQKSYDKLSFLGELSLKYSGVFFVGFFFTHNCGFTC